MTVYLDTSVVVPLLLPDAFAGKARAFFASGPDDLVVSDFVATEFASVIGIRVRTKLLTLGEAKAALANFDTWIGRSAERAEVLTSDVRAAEAMLRRLDLRLRAPDAVNIAIANRLGADLATFDKQMALAAKTLGVALATV